MRVLFVLATVVGSVFLVACSGGSGDDATATTAPLVEVGFGQPPFSLTETMVMK